MITNEEMEFRYTMDEYQENQRFQMALDVLQETITDKPRKLELGELKEKVEGMLAEYHKIFGDEYSYTARGTITVEDANFLCRLNKDSVDVFMYSEKKKTDENGKSMTSYALVILTDIP